MLPQIVPQQLRVIETIRDGEQIANQSLYEPTRQRPLPYRGSQDLHIPNSLAPPQRAYPVHETLLEHPTYGSHAPQITTKQKYDIAEHMLRRKTPNGTLAAGYDGTPVRWSTKPPATKHIVLPVSWASTGGNLPRKLEYCSAPQNGRDSLNTSWYRQSSTEATRGMPDDGLDDWMRLPPLIIESNTIFDRIPMHQAPTYLMYDVNGMQIPTVLQPPYQPCSGPTASNDGGLYGPYWPDGRFVPYRPAASRHITGQNGYQSTAQIQNSSILLNDNTAVYQPDGTEAQNNTSAAPHQLLASAQGPGENYQGFCSARSLSSVPHLLQFHGVNATWGGEQGIYMSPALFNGKHQHAQFKEKVLTWAHTVYVDLLSLLQQSGKEVQHSQRTTGLWRSYSQTNIYPKPPQQTVSGSACRIQMSQSTQIHGKPAAVHGSMPNLVRRSSHPLTGHPEQRRPHTKPLSAIDNAKYALEMLTNLCQESNWRWVDGMLLGGCLAYGLENYPKALEWYKKIVSIDNSHVEATSNLAATLLALNRREEAEQYWLQSVKLRPSYFEAVEHLIGLLCGEHRGIEAVGIIEFVERSLRLSGPEANQDRVQSANIVPSLPQTENRQRRPSETSSDRGFLFSDLKHRVGENAKFDVKCGVQNLSFEDNGIANHPGFGSSGYAIPGSENGRMLALVHAKGNMLYALGDISGAERAFEDAVLIGAGRRMQGIRGLIRQIIHVLSTVDGGAATTGTTSIPQPLLLPPDKALRTAKLVFARNGDLPGLQYVPEGIVKNAAISTTSNSLLSLAKIFQDGMSSTQSLRKSRRPSGMGDILALYYLSLSLQPSPSTANNVGIMLASVQQPVSTHTPDPKDNSVLPAIPGVVPGSGIALALAYYNYGLNLDSRHAHLYTNLGSLLKDIGQLTAAIKMYEQAIACDSNFDIGLANLANAVKDQGRISDAIEYYKRAVASSPDFAEAVCGLANALNSVCDWTGRGGVVLDGGRLDRWHVDDNGMLCDAEAQGTASAGWMKRVVDIVTKQLEDGANWGRGILQSQVLQSVLRQVEIADSGDRWPEERALSMHAKLSSWAGRVWEGARIVRLVERAMKRAMHRWYKDKFIHMQSLPKSAYARPQLPSALCIPGAPTVLPFHTFTCPLTAREIRMISQRNALRISCSTLRASWLPASVYMPPPPPNPCLNIGYVSSDFNNHPLAHLMQSVFGMHDTLRARAFCYATTASDHSLHRAQIEREAPVFRDTSSWSSDMLIQQIVHDEIHILVNLNGYTRGARNEVFAARPAPIQMSFMGFAGTLGAEWCDYLLADKIAIPAETLRPWRRNIELEDQLCDDQSIEAEDWVYSENIIFCRDTFFCCDHRQSSQEPQISWAEEQEKRWKMRKELFPNLSDDAIILGNFNQLYKIEPTTFRTWLRILAKVPKAILWLLRFPELGESNLKRTARLWAGEEVASRIWFTDVAPKNQHISRARVCDLFLDTPECNAHTTAADVLWSSTPLLTLPRYKYKMCSRMATSILKGALPKNAEGRQAAIELIAKDENQYELFAVNLASGLVYSKSGTGTGRLSELRKLLYESRSTSALFDTKRWVSDLELAYEEAWRRWVEGIGGDIYL